VTFYDLYAEGLEEVWWWNKQWKWISFNNDGF
jgi:hypothetical protein